MQFECAYVCCNPQQYTPRVTLLSPNALHSAILFSFNLKFKRKLYDISTVGEIQHVIFIPKYEQQNAML